MTAQHLPRTTRAIVLSRYGSPDVLVLGDVPMPTLADDAVLVRVQAASLHGRSMALLGGLTRPRLRGLCVDVAGGSKPSVDELGRSARATRSMAT